MKNTVITLIFLLTAYQTLPFWGKKVKSWKLYKDSIMSESEGTNRQYFMMIDFKYFGKPVQLEECRRIRSYYSKIYPLRAWQCINDTNDDGEVKLLIHP